MHIMYFSFVCITRRNLLNDGHGDAYYLTVFESEGEQKLPSGNAAANPIYDEVSTPVASGVPLTPNPSYLGFAKVGLEPNPSYQPFKIVKSDQK